MFKRDNNARFVPVGIPASMRGWQLSNATGWQLESGKLKSESIDNRAYERLLIDSEKVPVLIMGIESNRKRWWMFQGEIYWEDECLAPEDLKILILDLIEHGRKRVKRAMARLSTAENVDVTKRSPIPDDVRMHVWQRDHGRCVRCGSQAKLEFDHIIPVSKGGSDTARNLQLFCESCNREKGGNLV